MMSAMKLVISENERLLRSVSKKTSTQPAELIKSLEEFQRTTNEALTKLIAVRSAGEKGECNDEACENDDEADDHVYRRKKKKS